MDSTRPAAIDDLERFLAAIWRPGDVREVRAPKYGPNRTMSGYFDSPKSLADSVRQHDGKVNLYITANPVNDALLARSKNRLKTRADSTTSDAEIVSRSWLAIDIDPIRPTGISATEDEREAARAVADAIVHELTASGWPEPVFAMSGNGYLLLYPIDLPNDRESTRLVEGGLRSLAARYGNDRAKVDTSVGNASRIVALIGTKKMKGDSTPDRPHRRSMLISVPTTTDRLSRDQLEALIPVQTEKEPPEGEGVGGMPRGWVLGLLDANGVGHGEAKPPDSDGIVWIDLVTCPFHPEVADAPCGVGEAPDGRAVAKCFHDRGTGMGWREFKAALGLKSGPTLN